MSDETKPEYAEASGDSAGRSGLAWLVFQNITAVLAAFSTALLVSHLLGFQWRGQIQELVGAWGGIIRPATKWVLDNTVVAGLAWAFDVHITIPLAIRDYLSVGFTLTLPALRVGFWSEPPDDWYDAIYLGWLPSRLWAFGYRVIPAFARRIFRFVLMLTAWPLYLIGLARILIDPDRSHAAYRAAASYWRDVEEGTPDDLQRRDAAKFRKISEDGVKSHRANRRRIVIAISPLIYFSLLFVINFFLPK